MGHFHDYWVFPRRLELDAVMCGFSQSQCHRCVDRCNIDPMNKGALNNMEATWGMGGSALLKMTGKFFSILNQ